MTNVKDKGLEKILEKWWFNDPDTALGYDKGKPIIALTEQQFKKALKEARDYGIGLVETEQTIPPIKIIDESSILTKEQIDVCVKFIERHRSKTSDVYIGTKKSSLWQRLKEKLKCLKI